MPYTVVTVACGDQDPWGAMLHDELERLERDGWLLCAMTTKTVAIPQTAGVTSATRYAPQLVLVLHRDGAA